ncbi:hypothetical protein BDV06DRAFT_206145 [Aspergillus oleicola]
MIVNTLTMRRLLDSEVITCLVGPTKSSYQIHAKALYRFLKPQTIDGLEISTKPVTIYFPDVDEATFGHCCELAYTGAYSVPLEPLSAAGDIDNSKERLFNRDILTCNIFHPQLLPHLYDVLQKYIIRPATEPCCTKRADNYAELLLCHARIHRYAYRSDCAALCVLSLKHLAQLLEGLVMCPQNIKDIVKLLEFAFEESEFMDNLQHILLEYMVWNIEALMENPAILDFLETSPDLEEMVFRKMWA